MDYNVNAIREYHEALIKAREEAVSKALANREFKLQEKLAKAKEEFLLTLDEEIIAEAEAPYKAEIEQLNKFVVIPEPVNEEVGE